MKKISRKYFTKVPWYYVAVKSCVPRNFKDMDWSGVALRECYDWESSGKNKHLENAIFSAPPYNGYAVGKFWLDVMVHMYAEGLIDCYIIKTELNNDYFYIEFEKQILARIPWIHNERAKKKEKPAPGIWSG